MPANRYHAGQKKQLLHKSVLTTYKNQPFNIGMKANINNGPDLS